MNRQVETKLICNDARRNVPEEKIPVVEESLGKEFEKTELDKLLKRLNVQSRQELDEKLTAWAVRWSTRNGRSYSKCWGSNGWDSK